VSICGEAMLEVMMEREVDLLIKEEVRTMCLEFSVPHCREKFVFCMQAP
jgi:hypothetical protein